METFLWKQKYHKKCGPHFILVTFVFQNGAIKFRHLFGRNGEEKSFVRGEGGRPGGGKERWNVLRKHDNRPCNWLNILQLRSEMFEKPK